MKFYHASANYWRNHVKFCVYFILFCYCFIFLFDYIFLSNRLCFHLTKWLQNPLFERVQERNEKKKWLIVEKISINFGPLLSFFVFNLDRWLSNTHQYPQYSSLINCLKLRKLYKWEEPTSLRLSSFWWKIVYVYLGVWCEKK